MDRMHLNSLEFSWCRRTSREVKDVRHNSKMGFALYRLTEMFGK